MNEGVDIINNLESSTPTCTNLFVVGKVMSVTTGLAVTVGFLCTTIVYDVLST